jgi:membrane protease YdiL (CAAX protease family)
VSDEICSLCGATYKPGAGFCSACGARRGALAESSPPYEPSQLPFLLKVYIALLAVNLSGLLLVLHADADRFDTFVVVSAGLGLVTLGFAFARRPLWVRLYTTTGFGPLGFLAILLVAPVVLALVVGYVHGLERIFGLHNPSELAVFEHHDVRWMIGLVAVLPPIMEELAFRGVMYTGLRKTLGVAESFFISSFAFALLHLSLPSLLTHVPLGLYFCFLRHRSNSLWPSMFAHCLHNTGVILLGHYGW